MDRLPSHGPVLLAEVVDLLAPAGCGVLLDCTIGDGGHAEAMLQAAGPQATLIGIDLDARNVARAKQNLQRFAPRVRLFVANFTEVPTVLAEVGVNEVDVLLADLGVSSVQLDDPQRGFSFQADGPLDMRLDRSARQTAADLVNRMAEKDLADLIYRYGEERYSRRIARNIVAARRERPIDRTGRLAEIVAASYPAAARRSRRGVHPATRTFQALRIAVNDELANLERLLELLPKVLAAGGRAAIISFHSLEDRRVKQAFAAWQRSGGARRLNRKPIVASPRECTDNPRSRSAKLRGIEKLTDETHWMEPTS